MMLKFTGAFIFLFVFITGFAQHKTFTESEKATLDSMFKEDIFMDLLNTALIPKSYFLVSAGAGNSYFSIRNKQINASQLESILVITPSAAYYHKSGLGIAATAFHSSFNGNAGFYQFSISPSYSITKSKKISSTISYTHIFTRRGFERYTSPIKNDFYGNIYLKKPWLQPGITVGLSGGRETDYRKIDTVLNGIRRVITDTVKSRISIFSINAFVQHSFEFYKILGKKDGLAVTPQVMLNAGSQRYSETHQNPFFTRLQSTRFDRFKNLGRFSDNSAFSLQSAGFNLNVNYVTGDFGFEPQVYLDYYIPSTTDKRFTATYSLTISYTL